MEKEGFIRCINNIKDTLNLPIRVISTDRHRSIKTLMSKDPRFKEILHQFDAWHIAKGLTKKIRKAAKKKGTITSSYSQLIFP